jgi:protein-disulfide isomerase
MLIDSFRSANSHLRIQPSWVKMHDKSGKVNFMSTAASSRVTSPNRDNQSRNRLIIGIIIIVAVIVALAVILTSNNTSGSVDIHSYDKLQQSRLPDGGYVVGNPGAPVTLVEFADYSCPACQQYQPTMDKFFDQFVRTGLAKYEFRVFPTHGGQWMAFMGNVADCMEQQRTGAFWQAKLWLMNETETRDFNTVRVQDVASALGLDPNKALQCSNSAKRTDTDTNLGTRLGVQSTPAVLIRYGDNDPQFISGFNRGGAPFEVLAAVVQAAGAQK